jgi:hypothetical protein
METDPDAYRDQIEHWMDTVCEVTFRTSDEDIKNK